MFNSELKTSREDGKRFQVPAGRVFSDRRLQFGGIQPCNRSGFPHEKESSAMKSMQVLHHLYHRNETKALEKKVGLTVLRK